MVVILYKSDVRCFDMDRKLSDLLKLAALAAALISLIFVIIRYREAICSFAERLLKQCPCCRRDSEADDFADL